MRLYDYSKYLFILAGANKKVLVISVKADSHPSTVFPSFIRYYNSTLYDCSQKKKFNKKMTENKAHRVIRTESVCALKEEKEREGVKIKRKKKY